MATYEARPHPTDANSRHDDRYPTWEELNDIITQITGGELHDPVTVQDTTTVQLVLTDQLLEANIIPSGIDHADLTNIGTNSHGDIDNALATFTDHMAANDVHGVDGDIVGTESIQVLLNKELTAPTLTTPTITGPIIGATQWAAATHNHADAARGGTIDHANLTNKGTLTHAQLETALAAKYDASVVDALIAAEVAGINARQISFPMTPSGVFNTFTHGLGRQSALATANLTANAIYFTPFYVPEETDFVNIGINVQTAVAASTCRLGVFTMNAGMTTATLVLDAGTVDTSITGVKEITISLTLQPGLYWLTMQPTHAIAVHGASPVRGIATASSGTLVAAKVRTGMASGAWASSITINNNSSTAHSTWMTVAA